MSLSESALNCVSLLPLGGPGATVPVLQMVNTSLLVLQWEPPFTWPYTTIQYYTISANNSQVNWNRTGYTDTSLQIRASEGLAECAVYTFTVVARNELADGEAGSVTGGFPISMSARIGGYDIQPYMQGHTNGE